MADQRFRLTISFANMKHENTTQMDKKRLKAVDEREDNKLLHSYEVEHACRALINSN